MLRIMGRRYSRESYLDLVRRIRERIPECAITTDIIVGFPNETEEQFEDTLSLCEAVRYDAAFTFIYSPRKGTPAAKMVDNVNDKTKHERFDRLLKVVEDGVMFHSSQMVGKTYSVLVDGPSKKDPTMLSGYTESNKLINFKGPAYLKGCIVPVRVIEDHAFSMIGELQGDPVVELAKHVSKILEKEETAKAYLDAKKAVEESEGLKTLRNQIEDAQKKMMNAAAEQKDAEYVQAKKAYTSLMDQYNSDPLIQNFVGRRDELEDLLLEAKDLLS